MKKLKIFLKESEREGRWSMVDERRVVKIRVNIRDAPRIFPFVSRPKGRGTGVS